MTIQPASNELNAILSSQAQAHAADIENQLVSHQAHSASQLGAELSNAPDNVDISANNRELLQLEGGNDLDMLSSMVYSSEQILKHLANILASVYR